jgi:two-component system, sensor histidine kinase and response regulator
MSAHQSLFEAGAAGAPRVLVTDDDPTSRLLVNAALENSFAVTEAEHGMAAIELLEKQSFDLAILDLDMPVMDGFGVIERMRARSETRHLPIIVVTGRDDVVAIERAFALGATSFLCKPINWNIFRHQVGYVLQVARADRETRAEKRQVETIAKVRGRSAAVLEAEVARAAAEITALAEKGQSDPAGLCDVGKRLLLVLERLKKASDILTGAAVSEPRPMPAGDVAQAAVEAVRAARGAEAAQRIVVTGEGSLRVHCDRQHATLALSEILQNALQHSPADQPVRLGMLDAPPGRIRFEVEDRGPGIPEELLESGFEAFGAAAQRGGRGGMGLGIPIAKAICEEQGGHFGIISEVGRGTEVFLSFPAAVDLRQGEPGIGGAPANAGSGQPERKGIFERCDPRPDERSMTALPASRAFGP